MFLRGFKTYLSATRYFSTSSNLKAINPPGLKSGNYTYAKKVKGNADLIFVSGCVPLDPKTNKKPEDFIEQTNLAMKNLLNVLESANSDLENVVKCTVYLTDMADYDAFNKEYKKWFKGEDLPTRVCVAVKQLPFGVRVEVDAIAVEK